MSTVRRATHILDTIDSNFILSNDRSLNVHDNLAREHSEETTEVSTHLVPHEIVQVRHHSQCPEQ